MTCIFINVHRYFVLGPSRLEFSTVYSISNVKICPEEQNKAGYKVPRFKKYNTAISSCNTWKRDVAMPLPHSSYKHPNSVFAKMAKKEKKKKHPITQLPLS